MIGAVIVAPNFVDWNEYKDLLTAEMKTATGRDLEIRGDIKAALLPSPALVAHDVHLASIEGASSADMLSLEKLEVRIALVPILGGNLLVEAVKLIRPVVNLEILADGRNNMSFVPPSAKEAAVRKNQTTKTLPFSSVNGKEDSKFTGGLAVRIDSFVIEKGSVTFNDRMSGVTEKIENLNGRFSLQSLTGPMSSSGSAVVRGIPLSFEVNVSSLVQGRTLPFNVDLTVIPGNVKTRLSGAVTDLLDDPQVKGKMTVEGQNLSEYISALAGGAKLPSALDRPFGASANLVASQKSTEISNLNLQLNGTKGNGKVSVKMGKSINVDATLAINHFDLDALLKPPSPEAQKKASGKKDRKSLKVIPPKNPAVMGNRGGKNEPFSLSSLPAQLNATVNLTVEAITYNKSAIRQAKVNAELANREVTINQLSALLPGSSDVALFGFISEENNQPTFEGNVDMATNDLRRMLEWIGADVTGVPSDRLRKLTFAGRVKADAKTAELAKMNLKIDSTTVKGAANIAFRARPSFGANFAVDRLNLDGYLPRQVKAAAVAKEKKEAAPPKPAKAPAQTAENPLSPLAILGDFDANLLMSVGSLTFQGVPVSKLSLNATLFDGNLKLSHLRTANAAGLAVKLSGGVHGLKTAPTFRDFLFDVRGRDLSRLIKLAAIQSPLTAKQIGPVNLKGKLNGPPDDLKIQTDLSAMGGTLNLDGTAKPLSDQPSLDAAFEIRHRNLPSLLRRLGNDYRPAGGKIGGVDIKGRLSGTPLNITIKNLVGRALGIPVNGAADVNLTAARPKLSANLTTGDIVIDPLLPAKRTAAAPWINSIRHAFLQNPLFHRVAWQGVKNAPLDKRPLVEIATRRKGHWPVDPIDLTVLHGFDGDVILNSRSLTWQKYKVDKVDLAAALNNGVVDIRRLTGKMFGGDLKFDGQVIAQQIGGQYKSRISVAGVNMGAALRALGTKGFKSGRFDFTGELRSTGRTVKEMIGALNGGGNLAIHKLDISGAGKGSMLSSAAGLLTSLNQLGGQLTKGKGGKGVADFSGSFRIDKGIANSDNFALSSSVGDGAAKGTVDLPNWRIDAAGEIQLAKNIALQLLTRKSNQPQTVPFKISGALDAPNVKLETGKLMSGIRIPGLDKKLDKLRKKRGVGAILNQIFPGSRRPQSAPQPSPQPSSDGSPPPQSPPPQQAPQPTQQQRPKVDDFLKGILKGLNR